MIADFNRLNCAHRDAQGNRDWQKQIYGNNPTKWDDANAQVVACDPGDVKYVLDKAKVLGTNLTKVAATLNTSGQWVVDFNLNGQGQKAFGLLTSQMVTKYWNADHADGDIAAGPVRDRAGRQGDLGAAGDQRDHRRAPARSPGPAAASPSSRRPR